MPPKSALSPIEVKISWIGGIPGVKDAFTGVDVFSLWSTVYKVISTGLVLPSPSIIM